MDQIKNILICFLLFFSFLTILSLLTSAAINPTILYFDDGAESSMSSSSDDSNRIQQTIDQAITENITFTYNSTFNDLVQASNVLGLANDQKNEIICDDVKMNEDFLPFAFDSDLPKIQLNDVFVPLNSSKTGLFNASGFTDQVCGGEWTIYYNPAVVSIDLVHSSDFTHLSWYDTGEGLLAITAWNDESGLADDFTIAKIIFAAEGEVQDTCPLVIVTSTIRNCSAPTEEICHQAKNGNLEIVTPPTLSMDDVCIPVESINSSVFIKGSSFFDTIGSCECRITYNPDRISLVSISKADFDILYWYHDEVNGVLSLVAVNSNETVIHNFSIAELTFESNTEQLCREPLCIIQSTIYTDDIKPTAVEHNKINGSICSFCHCIMGDMNGDCMLNSGDVRYLALYLCGNPEFQPVYAPEDVNGDGHINSGDVRYLGMYLTGDPSYEPLYP